MADYFLGIDLGSTTSKAIIINDRDEVVGKGITNTRANYEVAAEIAKVQALYNARFHLLKQALAAEIAADPAFARYATDLDAAFQFVQFESRLERLRRELAETALKVETRVPATELVKHVQEIADGILATGRRRYMEEDLGGKGQFFRDIVGEAYAKAVEERPKELFEPLMLLFDKSITPVENEMMAPDFSELVHQAQAMLERYHAEKAAPDEAAALRRAAGAFTAAIDRVAAEELNIARMVGTGYGRALLPFPEDCIRSEILCHAFGAHAVFPKTRTVLDIGGQDTKAIQVDSHGLVTSFHMNDRCAAGCGRYLGYIADELNISLNELGPMAMKAEKEVTICSTCTVFAGAELRELLNVGERREDILAGLHKAIVMRALSLLARSGGVKNEFTFTGGVARNDAVLHYVSDMVRRNYGQDLTINVHTDSIFMGALGGAMFARRNIKADLPAAAKGAKAGAEENEGMA
ncbi:MAG: benzoyl-CoA reductase subunit A [Flavobacteriales bacterium]|nr:Benzoyl-CoA reductase subunit A [Flavobacteriales bacterium]MCC6578498.1 benzoyl-CoA reductase subunit A [Flavobacteriales bacterium]